MQSRPLIPDMVTTPLDDSIDEYLRKRLMPVEGAIPRLAGIEMYGNSIPAEKVGGDLFEYLNFQQRYNIDARIARAYKLSKKYLEPLPEGAEPQNLVDVHVQWLQSRPDYTPHRRRPIQEGKELGATEHCREPARALYHCGGFVGRCPGTWHHRGQDCVDGA